MGKGGTKFVGEAISSRTGKRKGFLTGKEMRKNMQKYIETGVHPEIEAVRREKDKSPIVPLPEHDPNNEFVFMDVSIGKKPAGRLVIELYGDEVPVGTNYLRNRCLPGSSAGLAGTNFHKLLPHYAIFGGKNATAGEGIRFQANNSLQSVTTGTVSVSFSGDEIAISLGRSLTLDDTHQVVGIIHKGLELLDLINEVPTGPDDSPLQRIQIVRCGATNASGTHEELEPEAEASKDPAARLQEESSNARSAVLKALEVGLARKRTAEPASSSSAAATAGQDKQAVAGQAAAGEAQAAGAAAAAAAADSSQARNVKARLLDSMLGELSSDSDNSGSES